MSTNSTPCNSSFPADNSQPMCSFNAMVTSTMHDNYATARPKRKHAKRPMSRQGKFHSFP
jgi:hypothetical protein